MMRPTEFFDPQELEDGLEIITPTSEFIEEISELLFESYLGPDSIGHLGENKMEHHQSTLQHYFKNNNTDVLRAASSLIINKSNNEMVAVCLISLWEELPLVSDIAVTPRYRSNRIASKLLRRALTVLHKEYEVLRLFVTIGNSAEALYYNIGFYPGLEQTTFELSHRTNQLN